MSNYTWHNWHDSGSWMNDDAQHQDGFRSWLQRRYPDLSSWEKAMPPSPNHALYRLLYGIPMNEALHTRPAVPKVFTNAFTEEELRP